MANLHDHQAILLSLTAKMQNMNWNDLRIVLAVERSTSFAEAAKTVGVNETTISRRLGHLESALHAKLFERQGGRLVPTESGNRVIETAERIESETMALENVVSGRDHMAAGTVRVSCVSLVANHLIAPRISRLLDNNPQLTVELIAESTNISLTKRQADLALRMARPNAEMRNIARRIGQLDYAVYGARDADKEVLGWIAYEEKYAELPQTRWIKERKGDQNYSSLIISDGDTLLESIKAGLGKAFLPVAIGDASAELTRLDEGPPPIFREVWLISHPDQKGLARIKIVGDWLADTIASL